MHVRSRSLTGTLLMAAMAALLASPVSSIGSPLRGDDTKTSKSSVSAAALAKQLDKAKLQFIAAKDPTEPGRFIAAMLIPGASMMLVSAKYPSPALLNEKAAARQVPGRLRRPEFGVRGGDPRHLRRHARRRLLADQVEGPGPRFPRDRRQAGRVRLRLAPAEADAGRVLLDPRAGRRAVRAPADC